MTLYNEEEKLWSGRYVTPLYNPKISLGQALLQAMKTTPRQVALISANNGIRLTYQELHTQSVRAAQNIQKLNFKKGDIFMIISNNNHELTPIVTALLATGYAYNALDPSFTETEITHMVNIIKPKLVFSDLQSYDAIEKSLRNLNIEAPVYTFEGQVGNSIAVQSLLAKTGQEYEFVPVAVEPNDIAVILCSSGTTGPPKAICLSHVLLLDQMPKLFNVTSDTIALCFSTFYWISGLCSFITSILGNATRIITTEPTTAELVLRLIEEYKVTFVLAATHITLLTLKSPSIAKANLSSLNHWVTGGSRVPLDACVEISKYVPNLNICAGYGMSEMGGYLTINHPFVERDCVGGLKGGSHIKIVDESGNRLGVGESGQICLKMDIPFLGYYNDKRATDALYDNENFIQSGDVGHFDDDGLLHVTDRIKDHLKYCNYMISPSEIEDILVVCPEVTAVCVVGVTDRNTGDLPAALVVRKPGSKITEREISDMIATKLADSRQLRGGVYFVDSFPMSASGKKQRRKAKLVATELYNAKLKSQTASAV